MNLIELLKKYLPSDRYSIMYTDEKKSFYKAKVFNVKDIEKYLPENSQRTKYEYHFKPVGKKDKYYYVFLDDLILSTIMQIKLDGLIPCLIVETSKDNYQVWLRFEESMTREEVKNVTRYLANKYNTDKGAIAYSHFGRLPTFYRKTKDNKTFLVKIFEYNDFSCKNIDKNYLELKEKKVNFNKETKNISYQKIIEKRDIKEVAKMYYDNLLGKGYNDYSHIDYIVARWLFRDGYVEKDIEKNLLSLSPNIIKRKFSIRYAQIYIENTVKKASSISFSPS